MQADIVTIDEPSTDGFDGLQLRDLPKVRLAKLKVEFDEGN